MPLPARVALTSKRPAHDESDDDPHPQEIQDRGKSGKATIEWGECAPATKESCNEPERVELNDGSERGKRRPARFRTHGRRWVPGGEDAACPAHVLHGDSHPHVANGGDIGDRCRVAVGKDGGDPRSRQQTLGVQCLGRIGAGSDYDPCSRHAIIVPEAGRFRTLRDSALRPLVGCSGSLEGAPRALPGGLAPGARREEEP